MPVRSVKFKLIVSRSSAAAQQARDLWTTHEAVNKAVKYYENLLLEMRGEEYLLRDGTIIRKEYLTDRLDKRIREACKRNGSSATPNLEALADLRDDIKKLYEAIVPSSIGDDGNAQQANAYIGPLTDSESQGFLSIFDKIENPPSWLEGVRNGEADAFLDAEKWLTSSDGKCRVNVTGSPSTWVRKLRKGDRTWPASFVDDYDRKVKEAKGVPAIIKNLKDKKVLPLFPPFLAQKIIGAKGMLSPWDRLAFRLAVGHLLSWESWGRKCIEEHTKRLKELEDFNATYLEKESLTTALDALRKYEQERYLELSKTGLAPVRDFKIRRRMIRSWTELRERWKSSKDKSPDNLKTISVAQQTKLRGSFGDPHLFEWLSREENHFIWLLESDVVTLHTTANLLQSIVERSREKAFMTLPDPVMHPRSLQWEPQGGSNLKNYRLNVSGTTLEATIPLLTERGDCTLSEVEHTFRVAPSRQFLSPILERTGKVVSVTYQNQAGELMSGSLNSADLLFNWDHLAHQNIEKIRLGKVGSVYFKLVVDIERILPEGWDGKRPRVLNHFLSAKGNEKYSEEVKQGLRILSVDLGTRTFASCSVFELSSKPVSKNKVCFPVDGYLWAVHERSFLLRLPSEEPDAQGAAWRINATEELRRLKRGLNRYRKFYGLATIESVEKRATALDELNISINDTFGWPFEKNIVKELTAQVEGKQQKWQEMVSDSMQSFRQEFGLVVKDWRKRNRTCSTEKAKGKSMWSIEHLSDSRRFLTSWSLLGQYSGHIRRLDRTGRGVFAKRLLKHLEGVKDDRLKTGADLLVQAARGYVRDESGAWKQCYEPCHAILFEDLSRYRMKTDRPKRENSLLMRWSHRSVPLEVQMQGDLYGIHTCETSAAFSSRYHAVSQTPGVRCHPIAAADLGNTGLRNVIELENPGIIWEQLKLGDLVPLSGGELFVCLKPDGKVNRIHADINAAQNLQRRFWTRHSEPFRLPCRKVTLDGEVRWLPKTIGKRLHGAMNGYGWLVPTGHDLESCVWEPLTPKKWKSLGGEVKDNELVTDLEGIEEDVLESSGDISVFFRDPSGVVLPQKLWYPGKIYWSVVKNKTASALKI